MQNNNQEKNCFKCWIPAILAFFFFGFGLFLSIRPTFLLAEKFIEHILSNGINEGLATLLGAVIGFSALARQTKIGFKNLSSSQKNQAELDRGAREHQFQILSRAEEQKIYAQKQCLAAALYGEIDSLITKEKTCIKMLDYHLNKLNTYNESNVGKKYKLNGINAKINHEIYKNNLTAIGVFDQDLVSKIIHCYSSLEYYYDEDEYISELDIFIKIVKAIKVNKTTNMKNITHVKNELLKIKIG